MAAGYKLLGKGEAGDRSFTFVSKEVWTNSLAFLEFFFTPLPSLPCVQSRRMGNLLPSPSILHLQLLRGCMCPSCFAVAMLVLHKEGGKEKPGGFSRRLSLVSLLLSLEQFSLWDTACSAASCPSAACFHPSWVPVTLWRMLISLSVHFRNEILHSSVLAARQ